MNQMIKKTPLIIVLILIALISVLALSYYMFYDTSTSSRATNDGTIAFSTNSSNFQDSNGVLHLSLLNSNSSFFVGNLSEEALVLDIIKNSEAYLVSNDEDMFFNTQLLPPENAVEFISPEVSSTLFLSDSKYDSENEGLTELKSHHTVHQSINDVPVFGGEVRFHMKNGTDLVGIQGSILKNTQVESANLTDEEALQIAINQARIDFEGQASVSTLELEVPTNEQVIINEALLGLSDSAQNYFGQRIQLRSTEQPPSLFREYIVNKSTGKVVLNINLIHSALYREIADCVSGQSSCPYARVEGQTATGIADIDKMYDLLGTVYNYFNQTHGRDSYDGFGSKLVGLARIVDTPENEICPNAFWVGFGNDFIGACTGMVTNDIIGHEFTHAITEHEANLIYLDQSGALNESVSDMFAYQFDPDWDIGEGSAVGVIRNMKSPTLYNQPDRLDSSKYYCGTLDNGGVHINSGITNKFFSLMVEGGTYNGCSVVGIGKDKALKIIYKTLSTYLTSTSNMRNFYDSTLQACSDLYGSSSSECLAVDSSLKSVQIDQQPLGSQKSPICTGGTVNAPQCSSTTPLPTTQPTPTSTKTPTPTPAGPPSSTPQPSPTKTPTPPPENPTKTPTPGGSITPTTRPPSPTNTQTPGATRTPTPTQAPTVPSSLVTLDMNIRLQGVTSKPKNASPISILFTISNSTFTDSKPVLFNFEENGTASATVSYQSPIQGENYVISLKGPKHRKVTFCTRAPQEEREGSYSCEGGAISITAGINTFDFSEVVMLAGDLPEQNGVIDSKDVIFIRNNLGSTEASKIETADLNYDGIIDTQDFSLVIAALGSKYDEQL